MTDKGKCCILQCSESVFFMPDQLLMSRCKRLLNKQVYKVPSQSLPLYARTQPRSQAQRTRLARTILIQSPTCFNQTQTNCITCGVSLQWAASSPRCCPNPEVIEKHLKKNTGIDGHIGPQDKVCIPAIGHTLLSCMKMTQLRVVQMMT